MHQIDAHDPTRLGRGITTTWLYASKATVQPLLIN